MNGVLAGAEAHRGRPLNSVVIRHMKRAVRSYFTSLRASSRFGRATHLRDNGRKLEALTVARETLDILGQPHVIRTNPAEAAVLASATVLVEQLALELNQRGAEAKDICDALKCIRAMGPGSDFAPWVTYLEDRAAREGTSAV
jgi:hypothetical protein